MSQQQSSSSDIVQTFNQFFAAKKNALQTDEDKKRQEVDARRDLLYNKCDQLVVNTFIPWWQNQIKDRWTKISQDTSLNLSIKFTNDGIIYICFDCLNYYDSTTTEWTTSNVFVEDLTFIIGKCFKNHGFQCTKIGKIVERKLKISMK